MSGVGFHCIYWFLYGPRSRSKFWKIGIHSYDFDETVFEQGKFTFLSITNTTILAYLKNYINARPVHVQLRKNRLGSVQFDKLRKGYFDYNNPDNLMALKWQDKREVIMLTTIHEPTMMQTRKTVKWYKKFFFHLLDLSTLNAYMLFNFGNFERN